MKVRFYCSPAGRSPIEDFLWTCAESTRLEFVDAIALMESGRSLEMPLSRNLSSIRPGLHELRFRDRAGQLRVVYFVKKHDAIYLIHAFRKKSQEIPTKEIRLIEKRLREI